MRAFNIPIEVKQPNGEIVNCFASGDDHYNWAHDKNGYLIVINSETGYYTFANYVDGKLVGSEYIVTNDDELNVAAANVYEMKGLVKIEDIKIPKEDIFYYDIMTPQTLEGPSPIPNKGTINNLCIFIRFSDDPSFTQPITDYDTFFNNTTAGASSVHNYFLSTSYNQFTVDTTFYPVTTNTITLSYQNTLPRAYYQPYDTIANPIGYLPSQRSTREWNLLASAVNSISSQVPTSLNLDIDNDGRVDDVTFIVYGTAGAWNSLLWPHAWALSSPLTYVNGKRVYKYNFEINDMLDVSVICHETQHVVGYPDLYNYESNPIDPVGKWDLMNWNLDPPQYSLAYMKYQYGTWIATIPAITTSGTYYLNPLSTSIGNAYTFGPKPGTSEFFTIEYRYRNNTFENSLPGSGLVVCRLDTAINGNSLGPPNEVYVFRPGGTTTVNGTLDNAYLSANSGRTSIGGSSNPLFYSDGTSSGIVISNISAIGSTMSFNIQLNEANISATKLVDKNYATLGDNLTYKIVMKNTGIKDALNVVVVDTIPNGTSYLSGTYQYNGVTTAFGNPIYPGINVGTISAGATSTVTLNVKIG